MNTGFIFLGYKIPGESNVSKDRAMEEVNPVEQVLVPNLP